MSTYYQGDPPAACDLCKRPISTVFSDASLPSYGGSWGNVCPGCARLHGVVYAQGAGQEYTLQSSGHWLKTKG